jgi:hypothetical protein
MEDGFGLVEGYMNQPIRSGDGILTPYIGDFYLAF